MEVEQEEVNSNSAENSTGNVGEERQISIVDVGGPSSHVDDGPSCAADGPAHVLLEPSHLPAEPSHLVDSSFQTDGNTDQEQKDTRKQPETSTVGEPSVAEVATNPKPTEITETLSEPVPSLEIVKPPSLETIPARSCISLKEPIEEAFSEELPNEIFDNSSENESVVSGPPQVSLVEEKPETPPANPVPAPTPPVPHEEQRALSTTTPTTHVEEQPSPLPTSHVEQSISQPPTQPVEHKSPMTSNSHGEHRLTSSTSENKYIKANKDVEGVDKRLAEVSDCPNLSLVDKVVITDVTTAKGTITVKECTTDEGFFANNVSPGESQTANGTSFT